MFGKEVCRTPLPAHSPPPHGPHSTQEMGGANKEGGKAKPLKKPKVRRCRSHR